MMRILLNHARLIGVIVGLSIITPAPKAQAFFLDQLTCGMDPLYDWCISKDIQKRAEALPKGPGRDIGLLHAFAGWYLTTRIENEDEYLVPRPGYYTEQIGNKQVDAIVRSIDDIMRNEEPEKGIKNFEKVKHPVPRMIGFPMVVQSLVNADQPELAKEMLRQFVTEVEGLSSPPAQVTSLAEIAWIAANLGEEELARSSIERLEWVASGHPSKKFRQILAVDIAPAEFVLSNGTEGTSRIVEGEILLGEIENLPPRIKAESIARVARAYGRVGMQEQGRVVAQRAVNMLSGLEPGEQVRVLTILMFARFTF